MRWANSRYSLSPYVGNQDWLVDHSFDLVPSGPCRAAWAQGVGNGFLSCGLVSPRKLKVLYRGNPDFDPKVCERNDKTSPFSKLLMLKLSWNWCSFFRRVGTGFSGQLSPWPTSGRPCLLSRDFAVSHERCAKKNRLEKLNWQSSRSKSVANEVKFVYKKVILSTNLDHYMRVQLKTSRSSGK